MYLMVDGSINSVEWFQHRKPGKGGAFMRIRMRDVQTDKIKEKNYRATREVEQVIVKKEEKQFLYYNDNFYYFMDAQDYTQMQVPADKVGEKKNFLVEGENVVLLIFEGQVLDIELPPKVTMKVVETPPGVKGNTVSGGTKKATLETGLVTEVPLFIERGEEILIDTRSGEYVSRVD
ncbi:MAG: elongation factor P [Elusimicrobiota bacterium]